LLRHFLATRGCATTWIHCPPSCFPKSSII